MFRFEDFPHLTPEECMLEKLNEAGQQLIDRLGFIWQANHGMLDKGNVTVRFNA